MEKQHIVKVECFVKSNLRKEFSLTEIANAVGYSAYHLSREYKQAKGQSIMEYVREQRVLEASKELSKGCRIFDTAIKYCFDTHAGFTKAFSKIVGCTPKEYKEHVGIQDNKGVKLMDNTEIVIRLICKEDVNDLWENVYSAMTPRQIMEVKILPSIEAFEKKEGIHLVAEVNGKVVMALPLIRIFSHPVGFLFDNNFKLTGEDEDIIMKNLLEEMKNQAKRLGMSTLEMWQYENSENSKSFEKLGFNKIYTSGGMDYLMMSI